MVLAQERGRDVQRRGGVATTGSDCRRGDCCGSSGGEQETPLLHARVLREECTQAGAGKHQESLEVAPLSFPHVLRIYNTTFGSLLKILKLRIVTRAT